MSATTTSDSVQPSFVARLRRSLGRELQSYLDLSVPHTKSRYAGLAVALILYGLRVLSLAGFYIITYALGIFLLNLVIGFISPMEDEDGFVLPEQSSDEFKPFVRRLPEFKFWLASIKAIGVAFVCTFFSILDIPVFWPILLIYFIVLFALTMRRQIQHMIQYKYVPFSRGKPAYQSSSNVGTAAKKSLPVPLPSGSSSLPSIITHVQLPSTLKNTPKNSM